MTDPIFDHEKLDVYRLAMRSDRVDESAAWYDPDIDYDYEHEHEHRFAEHE